MEKKKGSGRSLETFFAGKGFYIVLFLCMAVIGVSAWAMLDGNRTYVEPSVGDVGITLEEQIGRSAEGAEDDAWSVWQSQPLPESPSEEETLQPEAPEVVQAESQTNAEAMSGDEEPAAAATPPEGGDVVAVWTGDTGSGVDPGASADSTAESETAPAFFAWPVMGEVENGYCMTSLRYDRTMHDWRTHDGLDLAAEIGSLVKAAAPGEVTAVYDDEMLGTTVVVAHSGGIETVYASLMAVPVVSVGDHVVMGQVLGSVGDTALGESAEVTHLHFAMRENGESVDPLDYMP